MRSEMPDLAGVKVDEDYKRYYPLMSPGIQSPGIYRRQTIRGSLAWKWNMKNILSGEAGKILTTTDARGIELDGIGENREEPQQGYNLRISLDA